jgi:hypothetical protein
LNQLASLLAESHLTRRLWNAPKTQAFPILDFPGAAQLALRTQKTAPQNPHFGGSEVGGWVYHNWKPGAKMDIPV